MERLASQVSLEVQELQAHQGELSKVRTSVSKIKAGRASQAKGTWQASEVEGKMHELQQKARGEIGSKAIQKPQVLAEVEALVQQQEELGKAKAHLFRFTLTFRLKSREDLGSPEVTMTDLSERVQHAVAIANECKEVVEFLLFQVLLDRF